RKHSQRIRLAVPCHNFYCVPQPFLTFSDIRLNPFPSTLICLRKLTHYYCSLFHYCCRNCAYHVTTSIYNSSSIALPTIRTKPSRRRPFIGSSRPELFFTIQASFTLPSLASTNLFVFTRAASSSIST